MPGAKDLRAASFVSETNGLVTPTEEGLKAMWCDRLPSPAPEMLRTLAAQGERYMDADELAAVLGKKPTGGHWNCGIAVLRNNGLIETDGRRYRSAIALPRIKVAASTLAKGTGMAGIHHQSWCPSRRLERPAFPVWRSGSIPRRKPQID